MRWYAQYTIRALCSQRTRCGTLLKCSFNIQWMNKWKSSWKKKTYERVANMLRIRKFRSFQFESTEEVLTNHQKQRQFGLYSFRVSLEEKTNWIKNNSISTKRTNKKMLHSKKKEKQNRESVEKIDCKSNENSTCSTGNRVKEKIYNYTFDAL